MEGLDLVYPGKEETERLYQQYVVHREWTVARDRFLDSENGNAHVFNRAIAFADNGIAEAVWLRTTFNGIPPLGRRHLIDTLEDALVENPEDLFALTYLAHFDHDPGRNRMRVAAERGNAIAQFVRGRRTGLPEWYVRAAKQDHAGALEVCAMEWHTHGTKIDMLPTTARGAIMGSFWCMDAYANLCFTKHDQDYWIWKLRAVLHQMSYMHNIVSMAINTVDQSQSKIVYAIGSTIDTPEGKAFYARKDYVPTGYENAVQVYRSINKFVRTAVLTWMATARRLNLYKDVARLVGQLVWSERADFCDFSKGP